MSDRTIGIIMNGVTGRMGTNQHLVRSVLAIRDQGGVRLNDGSRLVPEPVLVGRDERKLASLAKTYSVDSYTTDLDAALADSANEIYFDSQTTLQRSIGIARAVEARKGHLLRKAHGYHHRRSPPPLQAGRSSRGKAWRRPGQALAARAGLSSNTLSTPAFSAAFSRCGASSVTGYSMAIPRLASGHLGIIAPKTAVAS